MPRRRLRRPPNRLALHASARDVFLCGIVSIVAFLLQSSLIVRAAQVMAFAILATYAGKRIRWGYFVMIVSSITLFNLLTPLGRVLLEVGPLTVTTGALEQGVLKGLAIAGLVFISLFAVRPDLKLPGSFGGLIARVFYYFEIVLESRQRIRATALVSSIDDALVEIYPGDNGIDSGEPGADGTDAGERTARFATTTDTLGAIVLILVATANTALAIVF
ncbi:MAG: hypothetical protein EA382_18965 [Spirochaetaceae bacterium]|nr:MAG: hypothetical protein EA382_18965 [Spirochaetaceae bacterium]